MQREEDKLDGDLMEAMASAWASVLIDLHERLKARGAGGGKKADQQTESEAA